MKIGELSKAGGVSRSTIHNYLKAGLLPPPKRVGVNLFLYSQDHLDRLITIRSLRDDRNMSLEQIRRSLDSGEPIELQRKNILLGSREIFDTDTDDAFDSGLTKSQQIVDKAIELFNVFGYERVRISDITDALNIGKGTFYLYFKNKKDLLLASFKRLEELILTLEKREQVRKISGFFPRTRPRFEGFQERYSKFAGIMHLIKTSSWSTDSEISSAARDSYDAIIQPLKRDLEEAMRAGEARVVDAEMAVYALIGMADNICYRATLDNQYEAGELGQFFDTWVSVELALQPAAVTAPAMSTQALTCELLDQSGATFSVRDLRFGNRQGIPGLVGRLEAEVDLARIESIAFYPIGEGSCSATVTLRDGTDVPLLLDADLIVTGESPFGAVRTTLRHLARLSVKRESEVVRSDIAREEGCKTTAA